MRIREVYTDATTYVCSTVYVVCEPKDDDMFFLRYDDDGYYIMTVNKEESKKWIERKVCSTNKSEGGGWRRM